MYIQYMLQVLFNSPYKLLIVKHSSLCKFPFFTHCTCLFVLEFYIDSFKNCIFCILHLGLLLHSGAYLQKKEQKKKSCTADSTHPSVCYLQQKVNFNLYSV